MKTVLISNEAHTAAKIEAAKRGVTLSKFIEDAILAALKNAKPSNE